MVLAKAGKVARQREAAVKNFILRMMNSYATIKL
jgi:hypothetical protein